MNGNSSEILYLLDSAQGLFMPQGNTSRRAIGNLLEQMVEQEVEAVALLKRIAEKEAA